MRTYFVFIQRNIETHQRFTNNTQADSKFSRFFPFHSSKSIFPALSRVPPSVSVHLGRRVFLFFIRLRCVTVFLKAFFRRLVVHNQSSPMQSLLIQLVTAKKIFLLTIGTVYSLLTLCLVTFDRWLWSNDEKTKNDETLIVFTK